MTELPATREAHHVLTVPAELDGLRLDQALARMLAQYSRSALKQWIEQGCATLNAAPARPRAPVHTGDAIHLRALQTVAAGLVPQGVPFALVHADDDVVVVDKPPGVVVHPGAGNRDHTLVNGLVARFPELAVLPRAGLVHRIDKDTSGLLLVARHTAALQTLVRAMAARRIARTYLAVASGVLVAGGTIDAAIGRDPQQRTRMRVTESGRPAVTHFRVVERYRAHTLLEVCLETGRTHQIRVHLAWRGHALLGDPRYGGRPRPARGVSEALRECVARFPRQALHAAALEFGHPRTGLRLRFDAPLPPDLQALIGALEADAAAPAG